MIAWRGDHAIDHLLAVRWRTGPRSMACDGEDRQRTRLCRGVDRHGLNAFPFCCAISRVDTPTLVRIEGARESNPLSSTQNRTHGGLCCQVGVLVWPGDLRP